MIRNGKILRAPFPWFGGKRRCAPLVWQRFGEVPNYVEPFFGSGAVLLGRPHAARTETVNDVDCFIANFWRAVATDPEAVAFHCDWPVNEADLHARHRWLVENPTSFVNQFGVRKSWRERIMTDPDYCDAKVAGWWVWGISQWIGSGWCSRPEWMGRTLPGRAPRGVHSDRYKQRPSLAAIRENLTEYMLALRDRLRCVRVCCGDWQRVLGPSPTTCIGTTAVFLDPPYGGDRDPSIYTHDDMDVAAAAAKWAREHGDDPRLRIAMCGLEGEHRFPKSWECVPWKANGGYGNQANGRGRANAERERIWFSPHCLKPRRDLLGEIFITEARR